MTFQVFCLLLFIFCILLIVALLVEQGWREMERKGKGRVRQAGRIVVWRDENSDV